MQHLIRDKGAILGTAALLAGLLGCGAADDETLGAGAGTPLVKGGAFDAGQGQPELPGALGGAYAPGPYGFSKGTVLPDFQFIGYYNYVTAQPGYYVFVHLSDFYNPTGAEIYAPGSPYCQPDEGGNCRPKPKALLINMSALWCPVCQQEAQYVTPGKYKHYEPLAGEFLLVLIDGNTPGKAAVPKDLDKWDKKYKVDFPSTIDPAGKVGVMFPPSLPGNMLVDPRTMTILEVIEGLPLDPDDPACKSSPMDKHCTFWEKFDKVIEGTYGGG
ncbi:MAG: hypothetical protein HY744_34005 [Deltaproteobacteria bacterium]|nr:hypothetical protein [Deltaproteobacteria bacterium]